MSKTTLHKELRQAGADQAEAASLVAVANRLRGLDQPASRPATAWRRWHMVPLGLAAIAGLFIGAGTVAYAQTGQPGSWTYPVKRLSEQVAVAVDPNYRATLMMRRSQEVKVLVGQHAKQQTVLATLADYRTEAAAYKTENYAAFAYCKSNLVQAAAIASGSEQQAINNTLAALRT